MTVHKTLYLKDDIDRLCVSRTDGGKRLVNIGGSVDASILQHEIYIKKNKESLIPAASNNTDNIRANRTIISRKQKWKEKLLYGYFKRQTDKNSHKKTWTWLRNGNLKKKTENLLIAAQKNVIKTNYVKEKIDKTRQNSKCGLCGDRDETINRIRECNKLAQKEYKTKNDWELCKKLKFDHTTKWYMIKPESFLENEMHKILCDFGIQTNHLILARRPNLLLSYK